MGIDDFGKLAGQARDALDGHEDQAQDALDKAGEALKARTGTGTDAQIDQLVDKAKDFLEEEKKR